MLVVEVQRFLGVAYDLGMAEGDERVFDVLAVVVPESDVVVHQHRSAIDLAPCRDREPFHATRSDGLL